VSGTAAIAAAVWCIHLLLLLLPLLAYGQFHFVVHGAFVYTHTVIGRLLVIICMLIRGALFGMIPRSRNFTQHTTTMETITSHTIQLAMCNLDAVLLVVLLVANAVRFAHASASAVLKQFLLSILQYNVKSY
jgi:hypothetical protein